jgi:hypothetical protein
MKILFFWLLDRDSLSNVELQFAITDVTTFLKPVTFFAATAHFFCLNLEDFHSLLTGIKLRKLLGR